MAWGGKVGRMSVKVRNHFLRTSNRRLPEPDLPAGGIVPRSVMRELQLAQLPIPDRNLYTSKLVQLMQAIEKNGG